MLHSPEYGRDNGARRSRKAQRSTRRPSVPDHHSPQAFPGSAMAEGWMRLLMTWEASRGSRSSRACLMREGPDGFPWWLLSEFYHPWLQERHDRSVMNQNAVEGYSEAAFNPRYMICLHSNSIKVKSFSPQLFVSSNRTADVWQQSLLLSSLQSLACNRHILMCNRDSFKCTLSSSTALRVMMSAMCGMGYVRCAAEVHHRILMYDCNLQGIF